MTPVEVAAPWWDVLAKNPAFIQLELPNQEPISVTLRPGQSLGDAIDEMEANLTDLVPEGSYGQQWAIAPDCSNDLLAICPISRRLPASFFFIVAKRWTLRLLST